MDRHSRFIHSQFSILNSLLDPLSSATVPLIYGLARQRMLRGGAQERQVRIDGVTLNYFQQGPVGRAALQPPILLIHGIADNALTWTVVSGQLARERMVYAIDLPGYGRSSMPSGRGFMTLDDMCTLVVAFLREVVGRSALVVGNSMGGWLAIKMAWAVSELIEGIILLDPGGAPLQGRTSWEPFGDLIAVRDLKASRQIFRQMFGAGPLLYLGQRGLQQLFQRQSVREFVASLSASHAPEDELLKPEHLRQLPVPAGLIWGLSDTFLPRGSLEFFRENLPGAPVLLLRHCGHLPQVERPLAVTRFIRRFAASYSLPPRSCL